MSKERTNADRIIDNINDELLQLNTPDKLTVLATQLAEFKNPFYAILLSGTLALEVDTLYKHDNQFWWQQFADNDTEVADNIKNELTIAITSAIKLRHIKDSAKKIEEIYRSEDDDVFILIDLNNIASYADLPDVINSLRVDEESLPNSTFHKGKRQSKGFRGGKTGYSVAKKYEKPRSTCLTRAYENTMIVLNTENKITTNGLTLQAVDGFENHVVITGSVEDKIQIEGQYNDQDVSPQEYILQVMYGAFSNEPVVAIENKEFDKKND